MISDIVNYMVINGFQASILYNNIVNYKEIIRY